MVLQCNRCGKQWPEGTKYQTLERHLARKFSCRPNVIALPPTLIHVPEIVPEINTIPEKVSIQVSETIPTPLSIDELANWLSNPEIKNNPDIGKQSIPKSNKE